MHFLYRFFIQAQYLQGFFHSTFTMKGLSKPNLTWILKAPQILTVVFYLNIQKSNF